MKKLNSRLKRKMAIKKNRFSQPEPIVEEKPVRKKPAKKKTKKKE